MHPAKNVICHKNVKQTAKPLYVQKICTDGNGLIIPIQKDTMSVRDVIVMLTAASESIRPIRSGTDNLGDVRRQAANITNVSSIPIPKMKIYRFNNLIIQWPKLTFFPYRVK